MAGRTHIRKKADPGIKLSLFDLPLAHGGGPEDNFTIYDYLSFRNIVIGISAVTFLIFLAVAVSVGMAILSGALLALLALLLVEMASRRRWEHSLLAQIQRVNDDYERLVREVARNRNDTASLRRKLADAAGTLARSYEKKAPGEPVEQRMIKAIAEQLSKLGDVSQDDRSGLDTAMIVDPSLFEKDETLKGMDDAEIGRRLSDDQVLQLVNASVRKDRIDLFLQPIVNLPQRKLRFYETFSRIRVMPNVYLPATRYVELAMKQDMMPSIDNLLLLRGLQVIRNAAEGDYNRAFFFNITSLTLNDPKFMGDLVEFISQNRMLAPQLIFEMGQKDLATMSADILPTFEGLSKLGCRFSMDQVKDLAFDADYLESRHIRFIKIDAPLLLAELREEGGLLHMKRLKSELDRNGIDVIVEKIETDRQLLDLLDIEVDYGQGYLFGKPSLYEAA